MIKEMMRAIRLCRLSLLKPDASEYPQAQVVYNEVPADVYRFNPYGLSSNPPVDSLALVLSPAGRSDNPVALIDRPLDRFSPLQESEVQVGNYIAKSFVFFDQDGNIVIETGAQGNATVTIKGNATVDVVGDADMSVTGNLTAVVSGLTRIDANGGLDANVVGATTLDSSGNVTITAPTVAITGNLTVSGTINAVGDIVGATKSVSTHTHADPVSGTTGPPL